ncbi:hypothetical protein ACOMHN_054756 [Nucella lapillus]
MSKKGGIRRRSVLNSTTTDTGNSDQTNGENTGRYVCSGRFAVDFARLCVQRSLPYIPEVVGRSGHGGNLLASSLAQRKGKVGPKKLSVQAVQGQQPVSSLVQLPVTTPAKTTAIKDTVLYFRPRIQVSE